MLFFCINANFFLEQGAKFVALSAWGDDVGRKGKLS